MTRSVTVLRAARGFVRHKQEMATFGFPSHKTLAVTLHVLECTSAPGPAKRSPGEMCWQHKVSQQTTTELKAKGAQASSCQWPQRWGRVLTQPVWRCAGVDIAGFSVPRTANWNHFRNTCAHTSSLPFLPSQCLGFSRRCPRSLCLYAVEVGDSITP